MGAFLAANIIIAIISIVIWYFLNRASIRANRIVELLELIDRKNNKQIELLSSILESSSVSLTDEARKSLTTDYFHEAKLISENLVSGDGRVNKDKIIKFAECGNSYVESEMLRGEDVNNAIDLFTILKNEKFSKLSEVNKKIANEIYKEAMKFI